MSTNPTSFRLPFTLPETIDPAVANAIRYCFNGLVDLNEAIPKLNDKVEANKTAVATAQTTATQAAAAAASPANPFPASFGTVNQQPIGAATSYSNQTQDFGALIVVTSSSAFTVNLNTGLAAPYFTTILNLGTAAVALTPATGTVNNVSSLNLQPQQFAVTYYDGTNYWCAIGSLPLSGTTGSLGGSPMTVGQTVTTTVSIPGCTTAMVACASPVTNPGAGFVWDAYVLVAGTVTVALTCVAIGTPSAGNYNVRVLQ